VIKYKYNDIGGLILSENVVIRAKLDIIAKKMFIENNDLLHDYIAYTLDIPYDSIKNITIRNPELLPNIIDGKLSRMDIKMQVDNRIVNLEIQISSEPDYTDRALYLWAMMYTGEILRGDDYGIAKPSICINIINFNKFACPEYHSHFVVMEKNRHEILSDKFGIHFFELKKIGRKANAENKKELWLQLINAETKEDFDMLAQTGVPSIQKAVYVLHQMSEDEKTRELAFQREIALHDHASSMKGAKREGAEEEREKWQGVIAEKDTALAEQAAQIAELQAKLKGLS
jgi:predicted transposase/invertase (TIGR01784 family)